MIASFKLVEPFAPRRGTPVPTMRGWFDMSIDPGLSSGWALWGMHAELVACGGGEPPFVDASRRDNKCAWYQRLGEHVTNCVCSKLNRTVIETPQSYPSSPVPPQDLVTLAFQAGRYSRVAESFHATVYTVWPHAWKGTLPKEVCAQRVRLKLAPEENALVDACGVPKKQLHNVLDAIGIGLVAFRGVRL